MQTESISFIAGESESASKYSELLHSCKRRLPAAAWAHTCQDWVLVCFFTLHCLYLLDTRACHAMLYINITGLIGILSLRPWPVSWLWAGHQGPLQHCSTAGRSRDAAALAACSGFQKMQTILRLNAFAIHMQLHTLILKLFESEQIFLFEPLDILHFRSCWSMAYNIQRRVSSCNEPSQVC